LKYADDFLLLAKEERVLEGKPDRLNEVVRYYGMEMNVEKTKVKRISRQLSPVQSTVENNQRMWSSSTLWVSNMLTNDARHTCEIKP
jgi:hypothetical protein